MQADVNNSLCRARSMAYRVFAGMIVILACAAQAALPPVPIGTTPIVNPFGVGPDGKPTPAQFEVSFSRPACDFTAPCKQYSPTDPKKLLGSYDTFGNRDQGITLYNVEDFDKIKTVFLVIVLDKTRTFAPLPPPAGPPVPTDYNNVPKIEPFYSIDIDDVKKLLADKNKIDGKNRRMANFAQSASWIAATRTLQVKYLISPQPESEFVTLTGWEMLVGNAPGALARQSFDPSWLESVTMGSHCPEPGSWAMMIAGFGIVGAQARRRRTRDFAPLHR